MKKWLLTFVAATLTCGTAVPVFADTTSATTLTTNDHAYPYVDLNNPTVGSSTNLHINFYGTPADGTTLTLHTTLGTLNGQGSTITVTASGGSFPNVTLSSTTAGIAQVTVSEGSVVIGQAQATFQAGPVQKITVLSSPSNPSVGGSTAITITATDVYGNLVADNSLGTTFSLVSTGGLLTAPTGTTAQNGSTLVISTKNGVAQANLSSTTPGPVTVTVTDTDGISPSVSMNGTVGVTSINLPITFSLPQMVTVTPFDDYLDADLSTPEQLSSERELTAAGVFHGDTSHHFTPTTPISRGEFAEVVTQYMGLNAVANNLSGTQTTFTDVAPNAWYDGAVAADSSLGYIKGDGTNHYNPQNSISYAEVAMILLNNLGVQTSGTWPNNAISGAQSNGLFNGLGSFSATAPATRGDVAIMVRNALHIVPPTGGMFTNGKTMEAEMLGYTWSGDDQGSSVIAVPGTGVGVGNEMQVQSATQTTTLHLANTVQLVGASTLSDLMGKKINYLTNVLGLVTYIEVTQ